MTDATVQTVDIITMEECNMRLCTIVFPESSSSKEYTFKIPRMDKTKYFLARTHHSYDLPNSVKLDNNYCIGTHERVMYPGIVYFQKQEDVKKAYEILKAEG